MNALFSEAQQRECIPAQFFRMKPRDFSPTKHPSHPANDAAKRPTVFGLATRSTPVRFYRQLIRLHRDAGLSFKRVVTFNLTNTRVDIAPENVHVPDGTVTRNEVFGWCQRCERQIRNRRGARSAGPRHGARWARRTRFRARLAPAPGDARQAHSAISLARPTCRATRSRWAWARCWMPAASSSPRGHSQGAGCADAVERPPTDSLRRASSGDIATCVSTSANPRAAELTRLKHPWLVGPVSWTPALARSAVVWVACQVDKPVLKIVGRALQRKRPGRSPHRARPGLPVEHSNFQRASKYDHRLAGRKPQRRRRALAGARHPASKRVLLFVGREQFPR